MKYVKLIAKKDTHFKESTEVYDYDYDYDLKKRIPLDVYYKIWVPAQSILVRGICVNGEGIEIIDGEYCSIDEFDVEEIDED